MKPCILVISVSVGLTALLFGRAAPADERAALADEPRFTSLEAATGSTVQPWRHALKLDGGLWAATGFGGIDYIYAPVESFNLEAGLGYGFSGVQLSMMPKVAAGSRSDRYVCGVGLALAIPVGAESTIETPGLWLNVDLAGYEHRFDSGLSLSIAVGMTVGLAGGRYSYEERSNTITGFWLPQGRVSLSYWF